VHADVAGFEDSSYLRNALSSAVGLVAFHRLPRDLDRPEAGEAAGRTPRESAARGAESRLLLGDELANTPGEAPRLVDEHECIAPRFRHKRPSLARW
jgi:hypothetical protein